MGACVAMAGMAAFLVLTVFGEAQAFRCGSGLVNVGDKTGKVLIECGPPTHKEGVGTKTKGKSTRKAREQVDRKLAEGSYRESSRKVERWFYNCGEHDFIYVLTFAGGVLEKEETEGYGKGKSDCLGRR
ncbi:MAG: DUF2845 domain-containing protein [Syntrophales bacterium]